MYAYVCPTFVKTTHQIWRRGEGKERPVLPRDDPAAVQEMRRVEPCCRGRRFKARIELSDLNYPDVHVNIVLKSHFDDLRGHCGLQKTSEVKYDFRFEISNPKKQYNSKTVVL